MKVLIYLLPLTIVTTACVTAIPLTSDETCSLASMVTGGVAISNSSGGAMATSYGSNNVYVTANSSTRQLMCKPAQTTTEKCGVHASLKSIEEKNKFNAGLGGKRLLTGLGYAFYFLPGAFVNSHYEDQKNQSH